MEKISAKVAQILDSRELVLNKGTDHGVIEGMRFAILSDEEHEIRDPDDEDTVIGTIPITKTIVKVIQTHPKMSVAKTFRTIPGSRGLFSITQMAVGSTRDRLEEFVIDDQDQTLREMLTRQDLAVRVGDIAREYKGD